MKKVLNWYLKPYYRRMLFGLGIKFVGTIMDLCLPWILAYVIDTVIPQGVKAPIFMWGGLMIICSLLAWSFNVIANRIASKVARDTTESIRHDLFGKIMYLSNRQTDAFTKPSLISRLTTDTYNVHQMLGRIQRLGVRAPILVIGGVCITLTLDPVLTLVLVSVMPIVVGITFYTSKRGIPIYADLQQSVDHFVRLIREDVAGIRVIKALSRTGYEKEKYDAINQEVVRKEKKAGMLMAIVNPCMNFFLNLGLVLVVIVGAYRVNSGLTEVGKILAFLTYFTIILNAMMNVSKMFIDVAKAAASADRIMKVVDSSEDMKLEEMERQVNADAFIRFTNVSFSYNGKEDNLSNINLALHRGETLGIIGATGAGKSTLVQLLLRFYDVNEGSITIDGEDIRTIPTERLRKRFGVVFQNDTLFEDTILENVNLGRGLTEEEIKTAISRARAAEFVEEKEKGYQNQLNIRGNNLSGGQKQRILIARALAAYPEILILDDSSSALDYKTDAMLRKELRENYKETTTFIIAQRISSIMSADAIMVLEDGKCVGYGRHEELMKSCEIYREIAATQMGEV